MVVDSTNNYNSNQVKNLKDDNSKLDKDDFLNMFLTELKYQDPMDPMDSSKMLEQTMQMTTIEQSEDQMKKTEEVANNINRNYLQGFTNLIGKKVLTSMDKMSINEEVGGHFKFYSDNDIKQARINILDDNGDVLNTIDISNQKKGLIDVFWDGKTLQGNNALPGDYNVQISGSYTNNENMKITPGEFKIESLQIKGSKALINIGNDNYIETDTIKEYY